LNKEQAKLINKPQYIEGVWYPNGVPSIYLTSGLSKTLKAAYPDSPDGKLYFGILEQALEDLSKKDHKTSASRYLSGNIRHATAVGVDSDWIREKVRLHLTPKMCDEID
jgi:hypothetical protein